MSVFGSVSKVVVVTAAVFAVGGGAIAVVSMVNPKAEGTVAVDAITTLPPAPPTVVTPETAPEPAANEHTSKSAKVKPKKIEPMPEMQVPNPEPQQSSGSSKQSKPKQPKPKNAQSDDQANDQQNDQPATVEVTYDDEPSWDDESDHHDDGDHEFEHEDD